MAKAGRPSIATPAIIETICDRLAKGESLVSICKDEKMPGLRTTMQWAAEHPDFRTEYARAREAQAEVMDDKIMTVAETASLDPAAARVKIEALKWRAAKLAPKRYGDKLDVTSAGEKIGAELDDVARATRIAAIFAEIEKRNAAD